MRVEFASDNTSGIAPEAMDAIVAANRGAFASYGDDAFTTRTRELICALLDADAEVHLVATGTAANALALCAISAPAGTIVSHDFAHILKEEEGAPEFFNPGLRILPVAGPEGKISAVALKQVLERGFAAKGEHGTHAEASTRASNDLSGSSEPGQRPSAVSFSNTTELGAVYSTAELSELAGIAREAGLAIHVDGARLANAAAAGFDVKSLARSGVTALSLGGSKSGTSATEAIVFFDRARGKQFRTRLKQSGQLISKSRFMAAPWIGMLESGAWLEHGRRANAMAARLAARMPFDLVYPVASNAVFARIDGERRALLAEAGWAALCYPNDAVRFMCSWATTEAQVDELLQTLERISHHGR